MAKGWWTLALTVLCLSGCQRVVFDHPPGIGECDARLHGRWLAIDSGTDEQGAARSPLEAQLDPSCALQLWNSEKQPRRTLEPTQLHTARYKGQDYLWVQAGWANRAFDVETSPLDDGPGIYLYRYRLNKDLLELHPLPANVLAVRVLEEQIEGDVFKHGHDLTVRIRGDEANTRAALATLKRRLGTDPLRFKSARVEQESHDE